MFRPCIGHCKIVTGVAPDNFCVHIKFSSCIHKNAQLKFRLSKVLFNFDIQFYDVKPNDCFRCLLRLAYP